MNVSNDKLLRDYPKIWSAHDVDALVEMFTEDCVYEDAVFGWIHRGRHELREFAAKVFAMQPDFRIRYLDSFATDTRGASEWIIDATFRGDFEGVAIAGTPISFRGSSLMEFRDGRLSRNTDFWDYADLMRQIGVLTLRSRVKPGATA